ncbi:hypothetical protein [Streptomyces sp. NPDC054849]
MVLAYNDATRTKPLWRTRTAGRARSPRPSGTADGIDTTPVVLG